jgi:hypothetical protein
MDSMSWVFLIFVLFILLFLFAVYWYAKWRDKVRLEEGR